MILNLKGINDELIADVDKLYFEKTGKFSGSMFCIPITGGVVGLKGSKTSKFDDISDVQNCVYFSYEPPEFDSVEELTAPDWFEPLYSYKRDNSFYCEMRKTELLSSCLRMDIYLLVPMEEIVFAYQSEDGITEIDYSNIDRYISRGIK